VACAVLIAAVVICCYAWCCGHQGDIVCAL